jgi:hypothetical protein
MGFPEYGNMVSNCDGAGGCSVPMTPCILMEDRAEDLLLGKGADVHSLSSFYYFAP